MINNIKNNWWCFKKRIAGRNLILDKHYFENQLYF